MYFNIYESDEPSRHGMNGFYFYQEATPVPPLPDFQYTTSFVAETTPQPSVTPKPTAGTSLRLYNLAAAVVTAALLPLRLVQWRRHAQLRPALHRPL